MTTASKTMGTGLAASGRTTDHAARPLPKAPVLGWPSLRPEGDAALPSVSQLPHVAHTTSGRAALLAALQQLGLPPGSPVLVPTYHCPTMVAPVLHAGLLPVFYPIGPDGLPRLQDIRWTPDALPRVIFVAHYFGLAQSLAPVRDWCDEHGIVLVEDCAHSFFGQAGERAIGCWGDFATASLSKFFPVPEGGLLASASRPLKPLSLRAPGLRGQAKGLVDVLEFSQRSRHLAGLSHLLAPLFWLKSLRPRPVAGPASARPPSAVEAAMAACDMARVEQKASGVTRLLCRGLSTARIVRRRRENFAALVAGLAGAKGARPLRPELTASAAPYVCPLWVEDRERADEVYASIRAARLPVFRWDQIWPGTPDRPGDEGPVWSHQVLQLLCHQDLSPEDIERVCGELRRILQSH